MVFASVVVPTYKGARFIPGLLRSLGSQSFKDFELVVIVKPSGDGTEEIARAICEKLDLRHRILLQHDGHFTRALNLGMRHSKGDILLFSDDDAILPNDWIYEHINSHVEFGHSGAISGRVVNSGPRSKSFFQLKNKNRFSALRRSLQWHILRPILDGPHPIFRRYRLGVFITRSFTVAIGPYIPQKLCLSLPCRGVNMSFKREAITDALFPENPLLKIAPYNEQYFGAQLVLQGWESVYNPSIEVFHRAREGLSKSTTETERRIMSRLFEELVEEYDPKHARNTHFLGNFIFNFEALP